MLLDDRAVLLPLSELQENPSLAWDFVFEESSGLLGRAVSMATFVFEKMYLGDSIATTKKINIALHLFNGGLVAWLFYLLFSHLRTPSCGALALVLAAIWLLSPIYASTVLYAVQRMAMLSTTFALAACIAYCYWRTSLSLGREKYSNLVICAGLLTLGLFSKENALVTVPIILLIETLWYQFEDARGKPIPRLRSVTLGLIIAGAVGLLVVFIAQYDELAGRFGSRPYTLEERLFTQLPVLWDYVSQTYWPQVQRMGIYHDDVPLSRSLLQPVTTFYAFLGWLAVLALAAVLSFKRVGRYCVLGLLWFLVGHSMEAGPFSLELYFEHRNYLPGVGLVLLLGVFYHLLIGKWRDLSAPVLTYFWIYAGLLAVFTASQVQVWSSRPLLIFNHYNSHPQSYRAITDMSVLMAKLGDMDAAREYSRQSYEASVHERSGDQLIRNLALSCIADRTVEAEVFESLGTDHPRRPFRSPSGLLLLVRMLQNGECDSFDRIAFADRMAQIFLAPDADATANKTVHYALASLENVLQRYANALSYTELFLAQSPSNTDGLLMKLHFTTALGKQGMRQEVISRLQQFDEQGKLTVREQQTLQLYLEQ